jgi:hypothetical protein
MLYVGLTNCCISGLKLWGVEEGRRRGLKKSYWRCRYCERQTGFCIVLEGFGDMSKRELIDCICEINKSAKAEFLAGFSEEELKDYLEHLMELDLEDILVCA